VHELPLHPFSIIMLVGLTSPSTSMCALKDEDTDDIIASTQRGYDRESKLIPHQAHVSDRQLSPV
ncbi:MAG: hypothetical protein ACFE9C_17555, partial [Candidatus Hodarchaeota archaeon]